MQTSPCCSIIVAAVPNFSLYLSFDRTSCCLAVVLQGTGHRRIPSSVLHNELSMQGTSPWCCWRSTRETVKDHNCKCHISGRCCVPSACRHLHTTAPSPHMRASCLALFWSRHGYRSIVFVVSQCEQLHACLALAFWLWRGRFVGASCVLVGRGSGLGGVRDVGACMT
jgi:hypothetical protein